MNVLSKLRRRIDNSPRTAGDLTERVAWRWYSLSVTAEKNRVIGTWLLLLLAGAGGMPSNASAGAGAGSSSYASMGWARAAAAADLAVLHVAPLPTPPPQCCHHPLFVYIIVSVLMSTG